MAASRIEDDSRIHNHGARSQASDDDGVQVEGG
jgi:hypothetical protein